MKKRSKNKCFSLFSSFFRIGLFTFGGGYAMISLIQKEVVDNKKWISSKEMSDIITIGESTPGPIAINIATFVGYKTNKVLGSICATLGVVLPSFLIVFLLSSVLQLLQDSVIFQNAFLGIRACVVALIIKALISMYKECPKNIFSYILIGLSLLLVSLFKINTVFVIILCGIVGLLYFNLIDKKVKK